MPPDWPLAIVIGKRKGFGTEAMRPHNLPFVMLGAGLLWFGWFGFNAGSELAADGTAGRAWVNTLVATGVAMLAWMVTEKFRDGAATSLGAASGVVAGLVAITPAAGTVDSWGAIVIGLVAGVLCSLAVGLKYKFGYDDSLDVVGVHLVGGLVGTVLIGLFATNGRYDSVLLRGFAQRSVLRWWCHAAPHPDRRRADRRRVQLRGHLHHRVRRSR